MFVRVRLILEQRKEVLMIPEQAIVPDTEAPFVYRVVAGKATRVPVKTGLRRDAQVEIADRSGSRRRNRDCRTAQVAGRRAGHGCRRTGSMKISDLCIRRPVFSRRYSRFRSC